MNSPKALLVRWKPTAPWRIGDDSGSREMSSGVLHSDTLYAAVCSAMLSLGWLEEWLEATAKSPSPAVAFTSAFPWQGDQLYFPAPLPLWPPRGAGRRIRGSQFVPAGVIRDLLSAKPVDESKWVPDSASGCLLFADRAHRGGPYRRTLRSRVPVDRVTGNTGQVSQRGAIEFSDHSGLWHAARFRDEAARSEWRAKLAACFRLLADTGIGGNRACGWGRSAPPGFDDRALESVIFSEPLTIDGPKAWWTLSLFHPSAEDTVDWARGGYQLVERSGRVETDGTLKKQAPLVVEGSVLVAATEPVGSAPDVAPDGAAHPVYRNGFAVSVAVPWRANA